MQIHIVRPGESLWKIAQTYGLSAREIAIANQIPDPDQLAIGQALVIPIRGLQQKAKPIVETSAYIDPRMTGNRSREVIDRAGEQLTYLAVFSYAVRRNGSLNPVTDQSLVSTALNERVLPLMVLTNLENGRFSTELAAAIFTNEALQDRILDQALQIMRNKGYRGLDFDFENLGAENRERYVRFLQKASRKVKQHGYFISTALAPKTGPDQRGILYEGHDYEAIGQIVDMIFVMTYEWGYSGGKPMAVAPINQVSKVMNYVVSAVPKRKIMMGIPLYSYDWTLPYTPGKLARSFSPQRAVRLAVRYNVSIKYDRISQAPWFRYTDEQGRRHEVWFEDARSIQAKFDLVKQLGIRGFYFWVLGHDFPQNWLLIQDNFTVRKRIG